jgi:hypothetical protein
MVQMSVSNRIRTLIQYVFQDWTQYETIVLISAGIGVTPFASIIKYIRDRIRQRNVLIAAGLKVMGTYDACCAKYSYRLLHADFRASDTKLLSMVCAHRSPVS